MFLKLAGQDGVGSGEFDLYVRVGTEHTFFYF